MNLCCKWREAPQIIPNLTELKRWKTQMLPLNTMPRVRRVDDSTMLTSSVVKGPQPVACLMSNSWSKKLRRPPPRRAVPEEIRHGLDYSLYTDACSLLLYLICHVKGWFFLLFERKRRKSWGKRGKMSPWRSVAPLRRWLLTHHFSFLLSPLLGNSHVPLSLSPSGFFCPPLLLRLDPFHSHPALSASSSLSSLSFYLSGTNGGGQVRYWLKGASRGRPQPRWHHTAVSVAIFGLFGSLTLWNWHFLRARMLARLPGCLDKISWLTHSGS